ncbi:zinc finger CCCH domain-containing protein 65-like [Andrographis paniculata]|uniref:zinc finger CCCH domain-containing protein 65-like n=1 Tax=Andrographis paniculata TaxID=175694 RepID=UPI0021E86C2C|nr:zinc finger CCCH domain-containing protein 65-like [Andrographis paniculata]
MVQTEPPNLSEPAILFPPHRRRPLLSRTYRTLIGILSHCHSVLPLQEQTQVDNGNTESIPVFEENLSINNDKGTWTDLLGPLAHGKDSRNELVQEISTGEDKDNFGLQEEVNCDKHAAGSILDHINLKQDGKQDIAPSSTSRAVDLLTDMNQREDCAIQSDKEQTIENSMFDIQMGDLGALERLEVDKDFSVSDFSEILDSCFDMDMVFHTSDTVSESQENGLILEEGTKKNSVLELQLKEMELEKLMYNSGVGESTSCPSANGEMEEGEISDDFMAIDASFDTLSEDIVLMQEKTVEMEHASQAAPGKEFICDAEVSGDMQHEMADASLIETMNRDNNCTRIESRTTVAHVEDSCVKSVASDGEAGTQSSGPRVSCVENGTPVDIIIQQNAAESQLSDIIEMNGDMKKKRKKGPLTKEKRAKKKKKERIKRAEKNRKLGVKRLKLPPITKKKKIVYCRHYIHGRCHEGEKCKFSHDTVPLTKSKPCGHFARRSCMKGDDCPFDHELSKYPCNNYATQGFCTRGSDCLFSHEIPANQNLSVLTKEGSSTASKVPKPGLKLPSSLKNSDSSKIADNHGVFSQKNGAKLFSAENNSLHQGIGPASKTTGKVPKGVSFLLNEENSRCESSGSKQSGSTLKTSVGGSETAKFAISADKINELPERAVLKKPRGLNFLSFAKLPADGSTSEIISGLLSKHNILTGKSVAEDEGKVAGSFLGSSGTLEDVNSQTIQSALCIQGAKENINGGSTFDKTLSDSSKKQDILLSGLGEAALSLIKERQGKLRQLPDSMEIPNSSSGAEDQSVGRKDADLSSSSSSSRFSKTSLLQNTASSAAVRSTLAFAAKFEGAVRAGSFLW